MNKTVFLYLRVSTQGQNIDNYKGELLTKADKLGLSDCKKIWIEEKITGSKHFKLRELNRVLTEGKEGDVLLAFEVSRIGRTSLEVFEFFSLCSQKKIEVHFVKNDLKLDESIQSQMILSMHVYFAQIEKELNRSRTKAGIENARAAGSKIGRPDGKLKLKLDNKVLEIKKLIDQQVKLKAIAEKYDVDPNTISILVKRHQLKTKTYEQVEKEYNERVKIEKEEKEKKIIDRAKRKEKNKKQIMV